MALSTFTWKEIESQARALSGATNWADPDTTTTMRWANMVLPELARKLSGIDKPFGRKVSGTLTNQKAVGGHVSASGGATYTAATKTITSTSADFDQTYVGGWAFVYDSAATACAFYGMIDSVSAAGTSCVLRFADGGSGTIKDIASAAMTVLFKPNPVFYEGFNLSSLRVKDIVKLVDATNGNAVRLGSHEFADATSDYRYNSSVVAQYAGDAIYIDSGSGITSFGNCTLTYDRIPDAITTNASVIDLLPNFIPLFIDELISLMCNYLNKPVPQEVAGRIEFLQEEYKKAMKTQEIRTKTKNIPAKRG